MPIKSSECVQPPPSLVADFTVDRICLTLLPELEIVIVNEKDQSMKWFDYTDIDIIGRMVVENKHAFAFLNKMPILPGHTLICPKRRIVLSGELTLEIWTDLLQLKEIVCAKLKKVVQAEGFNFAWNEGLVAGQTVPHFHLHVVPRSKNDLGIAEYEPRVFLYRPGSRADSPKEELIALSEKLREIS